MTGNESSRLKYWMRRASNAEQRLSEADSEIEVLKAHRDTLEAVLAAHGVSHEVYRPIEAAGLHHYDIPDHMLASKLLGYPQPTFEGNSAEFGKARVEENPRFAEVLYSLPPDDSVWLTDANGNIVGCATQTGPQSFKTEWFGFEVEIDATLPRGTIVMRHPGHPFSVLPASEFDKLVADHIYIDDRRVEMKITNENGSQE